MEEAAIELRFKLHKATSIGKILGWSTSQNQNKIFEAGTHFLRTRS